MTRYLVDTHLLLWAAGEPSKLSAATTEVITDPSHELFFSAASIWEVAIKASLGRADFVVDASLLASELPRHGYVELRVTAAHAAHVASLPTLHNDPFDRLLLAQANVEGMRLLTRDRRLGDYPAEVEVV